ncbi:carbohydrate ABC transporter permease [Sediminispirochaeta smaragdinae]|uniref:Binding-protein-dependent transport systems inner membrane component n=1 Tax=Sediminispirochaeta smaragdinae (strain DSM 11293 / JCM 15392 / SEBR 4228) TaxID=573413 RepID=E1RBG5_SEDSS|nr:carbohydrate ABC transporter permease [Sediminispirochaeta smaragdinae]ADK79695.1 binding-protein-dependent transport systems inner membrane component [Sediminispirochaeta smaragdinae DSM 11293]
MKTTAKHQSLGSAGRGITYLILTLWSLMVLFPVWTMVINSFKKRLDIYKDPFGLPSIWSFDSYLAVLKGHQFGRYFFNSILITVLSLALILLLGSLASYAIARWNSKLSRWLYAFMIAGMMIPIRIGSIPLLRMINEMGLMNSLFSLLPIYVAMGIPVAVLVLTQFIRDIPIEMTEAALIDGAKPRQIYYKIVLKLIQPAMASVAIYNLVPIWNDLWFPLIFINKESQKTVILGVTTLFGQYQTDWSRILAVLTLASLPILLLYLAMSRQFVEGLTAGAVKG